MHTVNVILLPAFALFIFLQLYKLGTSSVCVQCGGKGKHRQDCPAGKDR